MDFEFFLFLLSQMIFIVGSLAYFGTSREKSKTKKWLWYGTGVLCYSILLIGVCLIYQHMMAKNTLMNNKMLYNQISSVAAKDPNCKSERQTCLETSIAIKKLNDLSRPNLIELENRFKQNPSSPLRTLIEDTKKSIAKDQSLINECLKKSETNNCIDTVIQACDVVVQSRGDPLLAKQYNEFKKTQGKSEVLNFCKTLAQ